ncbi:cysteine-rich repeat secretory protein 38-like [Gossypium australe]|uniref:Cysteine-rich repeat secretory protein 38-like n=1 Tax=Gossypium australe TaxID=47621 RepID=A0A5B6WDB8_9ROSI|nr:cysteine-rich repeat secretory protein 38-like [Gossypium australe]
MFYTLDQKKKTDPTSLYASGEIKVYGSEKIYGLTQRTRDLSSSDCKKCRDGIIDELPKCCNRLAGGRVISGSCNFRYESFPFVKA